MDDMSVQWHCWTLPAGYGLSSRRAPHGEAGQSGSLKPLRGNACDRTHVLRADVEGWFNRKL